MNKQFFVLSTICIIFLLSACGNDDDNFNVLFFTEELSTLTNVKEMEELITDSVPAIDEEKFSVIFHVASPEKLMVEIGGHQGDLIVVDERLLASAINPNGLYPLDNIAPLGIKETMSEPHIQKDPDTEESRIYALPITNEAKVVRELGLDLEVEIAGFVPVYVDDEALSIDLMEYLTRQE
ncbi:hypothetical protein ACM26V_11890 [Salipaludibacillus sp. HK11]|uniref:hypothetical protein n=1 Tax=Salipaludibacillus sp. HK11 TaxID=3394320 RepID=UPI0039FC9001